MCLAGPHASTVYMQLYNAIKADLLRWDPERVLRGQADKALQPPDFVPTEIFHQI